MSHAHEAESIAIDARGRHQPNQTMLSSKPSIRGWKTEERNDSMILIIPRESTVGKRNGTLIC